MCIYIYIYIDINHIPEWQIIIFICVYIYIYMYIYIHIVFATMSSCFYILLCMLWATHLNLIIFQPSMTHCAERGKIVTLCCDCNECTTGAAKQIATARAHTRDNDCTPICTAVWAVAHFGPKWSPYVVEAPLMNRGAGRHEFVPLQRHEFV